MTSYIIAFLPMAVSLAALVAFILREGMSYPQRHLTLSLAFLTLYYFADWCYMIRDINYRLLVNADAISELTTPMLPLLFILYIRSLFRNAIDISGLIKAILPGFCMGVGAIIIYHTIGVSDTARFFEAIDNGDTSAFSHPLYKLTRFWTYYLYMAVLCIEMIYFIIYLISRILKHNLKIRDFFAFLFKGEAYPTDKIIFWFVAGFILLCIVRISFGRTFLLSHPVLSGCLSLLTAVWLGVSLLFSYLPRNRALTMKMVISKKFRPVPNPDFLIPRRRKEEDINTIPFRQIALENDAELIHMLLIDQQYYLNKDASLEDASTRLGLTKNRINRTTRTLCSCGFEQLLAWCKSKYGGR